MEKKVLRKGVYGFLVLVFAWAVYVAMPDCAYAAYSNFTVDSNGVLTDYSGSVDDVVIPSVVNGVKVTAVGNSAFAGHCGIYSVTIPDGVSSIGTHAFDNCSFLKSVSIPDGLTTINAYAFRNCHNLFHIDLPDSVQFIGDYAFENCNFNNISIPDGVTSIGKSAFSWCDELTDISLPDTITSIGEYAFWGCKKLTSISLPQNITLIDDFAFEHTGLTSIVIPESITTINAGVFYGCYNLKSVILPESIISIGDVAFHDTGLTSIALPDSLELIGNSAFYRCNNLISISIPKGVTSIRYEAFYNCDNLKSLYFYTDNVEIESYSPPIINQNSNTIIYGHKNSTIETYASAYRLKFQELPYEKPLKSIALKKTEISLAVGKSTLNGVIYNPDDTTDDKTVTWTSSDPSIAIVYSNGKVKGISKGSTIITAKVGKYTAECTVTVK